MRSWAIKGGVLALRRPLLVGILNVTPDSFSDGGQLATVDAAVDAADAMLRGGADMLDIGGESTRPGADEVGESEELERLLPTIDALSARWDAALSVDTRRASVADYALQAGASVVNDVSGFGDPAMGAAVAAHGAGWVLMHMPNKVGAMRWSTRAEAMPIGVDAGLCRVAAELEERVNAAVAAGVGRAQIAVDPGLGFGKSAAQNLGFLRGFGPIARLGLPVFVGPSRKSFIGRITGRPPDQRQMGTAAAVTAAVLAGADMIRVHDVAQMRRVLDVACAIRDAGRQS